MANSSFLCVVHSILSQIWGIISLLPEEIPFSIYFCMGPLMFWFFLFRKMHGTFSPLGGIYTGLAISGRNLSLLYFLWLSNILFTALWFPFLSREGGSHSTEIPLKVVSSRTPPGPDTFMILLCRNVFNCGFFYSHLPWNLEHFPFVYLRTLLSFSRYKKKNLVLGVCSDV